MKRGLIKSIASITFKGGVRTKVFITLLALSGLCYLVIIPAFASFSMRQLREVATSLSLSLMSLVMLILTIFLGIQLLYKDIENRIAHFTLSQPVSRDSYLLGKFSGLVMILGISAGIMTIASSVTLVIADKMYQADLPVNWENYLLAVVMEFLKVLVIAGFAVLFSSFSTNLFLPLFGTVGIYIIGSASQSIYDYVRSAYGQKLPYITVLISKFAYYVIPNLSVFDYKFHAIYNLPVNIKSAGIALSYALLYVSITLCLSILIFRKREIL
jgi:Cu-processing system permease protein